MEINSFTCSLCYIAYDLDRKRPYMLPCGHTFCKECVNNMQNGCPNYRSIFYQFQVNPNFSLADAIEEVPKHVASIINHSNNQEFLMKDKCTYHKREIDKCCLICGNLMCSVCQCPHIKDANRIISDENLKDITESVIKQMEAQNQEIESKRLSLNHEIDMLLDKLIDSIKRQALNLKLIINYEISKIKIGEVENPKTLADCLKVIYTPRLDESELKDLKELKPPRDKFEGVYKLRGEKKKQTFPDSTEVLVRNKDYPIVIKKVIEIMENNLLLRCSKIVEGVY